jgi:hypothetical protein
MFSGWTSARADGARVLAAAAVVAVLDIAYLAVLFVVIQPVLTPLQVFQSVAVGLLGREAYQGGPPTAALGAAMHCSVALTWTCVYRFVVLRVRGLAAWAGTRSGTLVLGLLFGMLVWLVMDLLVLPLTRAWQVPPGSAMFFLHLVEHALLVGLPIAWILRPGRRATP